MLDQRLADEIVIGQQSRADPEVLFVHRERIQLRVEEAGVWRRFTINDAERLVALRAEVSIQRQAVGTAQNGGGKVRQDFQEVTSVFVTLAKVEHSCAARKSLGRVERKRLRQFLRRHDQGQRDYDDCTKRHENDLFSARRFGARAPLSEINFNRVSKRDPNGHAKQKVNGREETK